MGICQVELVPKRIPTLALAREDRATSMWRFAEGLGLGLAITEGPSGAVSGRTRPEGLTFGVAKLLLSKVLEPRNGENEKAPAAGACEGEVHRVVWTNVINVDGL